MNMKGINPLYLEICYVISAISIFWILEHFKLRWIPYLLIFWAIILSLIYIVLKINKKIILSKIDRGNPIESIKGCSIDWKNILLAFAFVVFLEFILYIIHVPYNGVIDVGIVAIGILIGLHNSYNLEIYEKGILIDGMAYYTWNEIKKITDKDKNQTILKIKGAPKNIVINKII